MTSDLEDLEYFFSGLPERDEEPFCDEVPKLSTGDLPGIVATVAQIEDQFISVATSERDPITLYNGLYPELRLGDPLMVYPDGSGGWSLSCPAWWIPEDPDRHQPRWSYGSRLDFEPTAFDPECDCLIGTVNGISADLARRDLIGLPRVPVYPLESFVGRTLKVRIYDPRQRPIPLSAYLPESFTRRYAKSDWSGGLLGKDTLHWRAGHFLLALLELVEHQPTLPASVVGVDSEASAGALEVELYGVRLPVPSPYLSWQPDPELKPPWRAGDAITVEVEIDLAADSLLPRIVSSSDPEWRRVQEVFHVGCRIDGSCVVPVAQSSTTGGLQRRGVAVEVRGPELCSPGLVSTGDLTRGNDPYDRPFGEAAHHWLADGELEVVGYDEAGPRLLLSRAHCLPIRGRRYSSGELVPVRTKTDGELLLAYWDLGHAARLPKKVGKQFRRFSWLRVAAVAGKRVLFDRVVNRRLGRVFETDDGEVGVQLDDGTRGLLADGSHAAVGEEVEVGLGDVVFDRRVPTLVFELCSIRKGARMQARVLSANKGRLIVDLYGTTATLYCDDMDLPVRSKKKLETFVGRYLKVVVTRDDGQIEVTQVSSLGPTLLAEGLSQCKAEIYPKLTEGAWLPGVVKNITDYGVFIDLGGIDGLLHVSEISWGRFKHPLKHFSVGDEIEVVVLKFDPETDRVSLGYKQRTEDPWTLVDKKYPIGSRVPGKVVSLVDYGAFVELEEGVEGLIHFSQMSWTKEVVHPAEILNVGDEVEAIVSELDMGQRRIGLSLRQTEANPWEELSISYPVGSIIEGKVIDLIKLVAFIEITGDIVGLIHVSDMSWTKRVKHPSEVLRKGDLVKARITNIDVVKQLVWLSIKECLPNPWDGFVTRHHVDDMVAGKIANVTDFGLFIDIYKGLQGLAHISEIDLRGQRHQDHYLVGDWVRVRILRIEEDKKKVGLTMLDVPQPDKTEIVELEEADRQGKARQTSDAVVEVKESNETYEELEAVPDSLQSVDNLPLDQIEQERQAMQKSTAVVEGAGAEEGVDDESRESAITKIVRGVPFKYVPGKISCYTFSSHLKMKRHQIEGTLQRASLAHTEFWRPLTHEEFAAVTDALQSVGGEMLERASLQSAIEDIPSEDLIAQHQIGDTVVGKVTSVTDFGLFINILKGPSGFADASEIDLAVGSVENYDSDWVSLKDHYNVGDWVRARILHIEETKKRIAVTMHDVPQPDEEEISELKKGDRERKARHLSAAASEAKDRVGAGETVAAVASKIGRGCRPTFVPGKTSCQILSSELSVKKNQIEDALRRTPFGEIEFERPLVYEEFEALMDALSFDDP